MAEPNIAPTAVNHIAFCVRNMDKSLAFYRDILGMSVISDQMEDTTTRNLPYIYRYVRKSRRQVQLQYGEGNPPLFLSSHPYDRLDGNPIKLDQVGISHIAFTVKDVKALTDELVSKGVKLAGTREAYTNAQGNIPTIYVHDPDGILLQFSSGGANGH